MAHNFYARQRRKDWQIYVVGVREVAFTCNLELESVNQPMVNEKRPRMEAAVTVSEGFGMICRSLHVTSTLGVLY